MRQAMASGSNAEQEHKIEELIAALARARQ
jgi:hypothetical protein